MYLDVCLQRGVACLLWVWLWGEVCLSLHVSLSGCFFIILSIFLWLYVGVNISDCLSVCRSISICVCLYVCICLSLYASVCREVWPDRREFGSEGMSMQEEFMSLREICFTELPSLSQSHSLSPSSCICLSVCVCVCLPVSLHWVLFISLSVR